jgi:hypothetical protein
LLDCHYAQKELPNTALDLTGASRPQLNATLGAHEEREEERPY